MPALSPALELVNDQSTRELIADRFWYRLYEDDDEFERFKEWADDSDNDDDSSYNERQNAGIYSGYVLKIKCDASEAATDNGSGCCLRHKSLGGFCLLATNADGAQYATYSLTDDNFDTLTGSSTVNSALASWQLSATSDNDAYFERFHCPTAIGFQFDCYKFQLKGSEDSDGYPRFDTGSGTATAYFIDADSTGAIT